MTATWRDRLTGHSCDILVRNTSLGGKLDTGRSDTATHALKDLVHDELTSS